MSSINHLSRHVTITCHLKKGYLATQKFQIYLPRVMTINFHVIICSMSFPPSATCTTMCNFDHQKELNPYVTCPQLKLPCHQHVTCFRCQPLFHYHLSSCVFPYHIGVHLMFGYVKFGIWLFSYCSHRGLDAQIP